MSAHHDHPFSTFPRSICALSMTPVCHVPHCICLHLALIMAHACQSSLHSPPGCHLSGEVKAELIQVLSDLVARHQAARAAVTEEVVDAFFAVRPMALVASGKA
jgi:hypothetical protein